MNEKETDFDFIESDGLRAIAAKHARSFAVGLAVLGLSRPPQLDARIERQRCHRSAVQPRHGLRVHGVNLFAKFLARHIHRVCINTTSSVDTS